jgi:U4/U6 small nuclear ribonucleoprotein PRP4
MSQRIHFGSLEDIPYEDESHVDGVALEELEADHIPQAHQPSTEQAELLSQQKQMKLSRQLTIPTADAIVRQWLRAINEPVTLFGEGPYDRRERLCLFLAEPGRKSLYQELLATTIKEKETFKTNDEEEFFMTGSDALVAMRKWLVHYSLPRAAQRIQKERTFHSQPLAVIKNFRLSSYGAAKGIQLVASQVSGERPISACSLSPDAQLIATGDFAGNCKIWSIHDCNLLRELEGLHISRIGSILFNPDQSLPCQVATCDSEGKIALWKLDRPDVLGELAGHTQRVAKISFHPSGRLLGSASFDYSWRLWDLETATELQLQEGHSKGVYSIAFHSDGALVATGGMDAHARIWDIRLGRAVWTLQGHIKSVLSINWNPVTPLIATGGEDATVHIWDLRKLQPVYILPAHPSVVSSVKYNDNGQMLLTTGFEGMAKLWGATDYKSLNNLTGHESKILDADYIGDTIVTASADRTFKVWK